MGALDGKVAVVTGAARGMGASHARALAGAGACVVLGDVAKEGRAVAEEIGSAARFQHLDVRLSDSWERLVGIATSTFGPPDVLVNNAAVISKGLLLEVEEEAFRRVIDVDLIGTWLGIKHLAPWMVENGGGSIINISSIAGLRGHVGSGGYVAAKGGVMALTKAAALELGEGGVRVNCVLPGWVDTPLLSFREQDLRDPQLWEHQPLRRIGDPRDVSELVVFLAGDGSAYCTGADFVVDGGASVGYANPPTVHG